MDATLPPTIIEVKNGCISNRIVTFQIVRHFSTEPMDYGRKSMGLKVPTTSYIWANYYNS